MKPHAYTNYRAQIGLAVLQRRLEARKIAAIVMGNVLVLAVLLAPLVADEIAPLFYGLLAGSALHLVWCAIVGGRLARKIRRLKEDLR